MVTRVFLVRHCQTQGNETGLFQGATDTPLSPKGIFQLGLLSARFRGEKLDRIYTSPQARARKTADSINAFHGVSVTQEPRFAEISVGGMDGMDCREIPKHYYEAARQWNEEPWNFVSPGGETMRQTYARAAEAFREIVGQNQGKTLLVASHGCLLRNLLCYCSGLPIEGLGEIPLGNNTAVSLVEVDAAGKMTVLLLSDCAHLPPELCKPRRQFRFVLEGL